jgi:hypothetical protein
MKKLSELADDDFLMVNDYIMTKDEFLASSEYLDRETEDYPDVYTAKVKPLVFDVGEWVEGVGDGEDYEGWYEDIITSLSSENIKLIEKIMNEASEKHPVGTPYEEVNIEE